MFKLAQSTFTVSVLLAIGVLVTMCNTGPQLQ